MTHLKLIHQNYQKSKERLAENSKQSNSQLLSSLAVDTNIVHVDAGSEQSDGDAGRAKMEAEYQDEEIRAETGSGMLQDGSKGKVERRKR